MTARYPGRCECGATVKPGDRITLAEGYTVRGKRPIILCGACRPELRRGVTIEVETHPGRVVLATVLHRADGAMYGLTLRHSGFDESFGRAWARVKIDGDTAGYDKFGPEWGGSDDRFAAYVAGMALRLDATAFRPVVA